MSGLLRTIFYRQHQALGAKLVDFGGWEMPIQYTDGILKEHIATRKYAGIFDVSHMGRLVISGSDCVAFLQHVLTNNCEVLAVGESQYTLIQNTTGGAIDDAYLYRFTADEYLLVVNASNREKDLVHLRQHQLDFPDTVILDRTDDTAMLSLQGPMSKKILEGILSDGFLPLPGRNHLSVVHIAGAEVLLARTGYTGEPIGFELFVENDSGCALWDLLIEHGAAPIGLGARDTLRLEAALPLYGHELGTDHGGDEIPLFAPKHSKFAVSFSERKGDFIGREALSAQYSTFKDIVDHNFLNIAALPKMVMPIAITGKGIARNGHKVFCGEKEVGYITSGTSVPYRPSLGSGLDSVFAEEVKRRSIALALIDSTCMEGDLLEIEIRKKRCAAVVVSCHINSQDPPYVRVIIHGQSAGNLYNRRD